MHKRGLGVLALVVALLLSGSAGASAAGSPRSSNGGSDFWTHARVAKAKPRDFVFDRATNSYKPAAGKPSSGGTTTGSSWTKGGAVKITTGKVLFELGGSYYVCSGSIVDDNSTSSSVVLTAAHCVAENDGTMSKHWTFIPDYDSAPAPLSTSNASYCSSTRYGCWTATQIAVDTHFLNAGGFNDEAVQYDFAFVRVGAGGLNGTQLDAISGALGGQAIAFASGSDMPLAGSTAYAFGYPASGKYKGNDLVYSAGTVGKDPYTDNLTYALPSNMTGGSSGGPWLSGFDTSTGVGTLGSVNSYGYSGITKMHGPVLDGAAATLYNSVD